jgi:hypothetical protein
MGGHDLWQSVAKPFALEPSFGAADGSSPIISQGTPIRSICALTSSGSAE